MIVKMQEENRSVFVCLIKEHCSKANALAKSRDSVYPRAHSKQGLLKLCSTVSVNVCKL